jgi:hypothetical protein
MVKGDFFYLFLHDESIELHELARAYKFRFPTQVASYKVLISLIGGLGPVYFSGRFHSTFKTIPLGGSVGGPCLPLNLLNVGVRGIVYLLVGLRLS